MPATRRPTPAKPARRQSERRGPVRVVPDVPRITVHPEDLSDFNESINWLIYGDSGVGKTVLSSFAPRAYFLSTEQGVISAKRAGSKAKLLRAPTWDHVESSLDWADKNLGTDDWMILDSLSKMQTLLRFWWLGIKHAENERRDIDVPEIQDHQKLQNMFLRFVHRIMLAQYNTIFTATAMHKEDPEGDSLVLPAILGKDYAIANSVCADMDIVSCLRIQRQDDMDAPTRRVLLNETWPPYFGKDRYHVLPRWEEIPDGEYDVIEDMIRDILEIDPEQRKAAKADSHQAALPRQRSER